VIKCQFRTFSHNLKGYLSNDTMWRASVEDDGKHSANRWARELMTSWASSLSVLTSCIYIALTVVSCSSGPPTSRVKRVTPLGSQERAFLETEPKVALVVGVGGYPLSSGLSHLSYAARDADSMRAVLERQKYIVECLTEAEATRQGVIDSLDRVIRRAAGTKGTIVFYFSGHGFEVDGTNYLAPYDADRRTLKDSSQTTKAAIKNL
jgi:hypothetical protein